MSSDIFKNVTGIRPYLFYLKIGISGDISDKNLYVTNVTGIFFNFFYPQKNIKLLFSTDFSQFRVTCPHLRANEDSLNKIKTAGRANLRILRCPPVKKTGFGKMAKRIRIKDFTKDDITDIHETAKKIISLPMFQSDEIKDIEQELALGLFKKSHHFRSKKSSWITFRKEVFVMYTKKIIHERIKPSSRYMLSPSLSLNETMFNDPHSQDETTTLMDAVTNDHQLADGTESTDTQLLALQFDVRSFIAGLPDDLHEICEALMKNGSQKEAIASLKITRMTISRKIANIRELMIDAGLDQYLSSKRGGMM